MVDFVAAKLVGGAAAQVAEVRARALPTPVTNSRYPFSIGGVSGSASMSRSQFYFPKGGKNLRLQIPGAIAGAVEVSFGAAIPQTYSVAIAPAPWNSTKQYQVGDKCVYYPTTGGGGAYVNNPYFECLVPNTNSPPKPGNTNWKAGTRPVTKPVTFSGVPDGTVGTQTLPSGTVVAKDQLISDVLPVTIPAGGYLELWHWVNNSNGTYPVQNVMPPAHLGGGLSRGVGQGDYTGSAFPNVGPQASNTWFDPLINGSTLTDTPTVAIIEDSIGNSTVGSSGLAALAPVGGATGAGYAVGDLVTIDNAGATAGAVSAGSQAMAVVDTVSSGAITALRVVSNGSYSGNGTQTGQTMPSATQGLIALTGSGTGGTATATFAAGSTFDYGSLEGAQGHAQRGLFAAGLPFLSLSANGDRANLWAVRSYSRMAAFAAAPASTVIIELVNNDIFGTSDPATTIIANLQSIAADVRARGAKKVYLCTCTPATTSTTAAGQSTLADQVLDARDATIRQPFNALARAIPAGFDGCVDLAASVEEGGASAPTGKWLPIGGKPAAADGKHPGPSAAALMSAVITAKAVEFV